MKMKWGALVVDGSGKIGGHVASKNRSGSYLRTKTTPVNPSTSYQQEARAVLGALSTQWGLLSSAQRDSFNSAVSQFAKTDIFGDLKNPSGFNLFVKLNSNLINSGQAQITQAPLKEEIPYSAVTSCVFDVSDQSATLTFATTDLDGAKIFVYATPTLSDGTTYAKNKKRLVGVYTVASQAVSFGSDYTARFGSFIIGANIQVEAKVVLATGQVGNAIAAPITVQN